MTGARYATVWLGGIALLTAALLDTLSVIGRHVGLPFHGAIEAIQAAVLVAGSVSLVIATTRGSHARVRLILDRLPPVARLVGEKACAVAVALAFLLVFCGSLWIAIDLWGGHERSELLGVPWRALRLFANLCLPVAAIAAIWPVREPRS